MPLLYRVMPFAAVWMGPAVSEDPMPIASGRGASIGESEAAAGGGEHSASPPMAPMTTTIALDPARRRIATTRGCVRRVFP